MANDAVLAAVEARRQQIREQAAWAIQGIEAKRDAELAELDIDTSTEASTPAPAPSPSPASPKRRQKKASTSPSPAAAMKRREDVHRFIHDQGGEVAPKIVREALGMSENTFRKAATRLVEAGALRKIGERQFTRYESIKSPGSAPAAAPAGKAGRQEPERDGRGQTLGGRILADVTYTGGSSEDELAERLECTPDEIRTECGNLIREGEIRFERWDGKNVYVVDPSAA